MNGVMYLHADKTDSQAVMAAELHAPEEACTKTPKTWIPGRNIYYMDHDEYNKM